MKLKMLHQKLFLLEEEEEEEEEERERLNTLESYELNWPSSLNPNHVNLELREDPLYVAGSH